MMKIRLTRKFSQLINGIDLSQVREGDTLELPARDADMLVAEGWAVAADGMDRDRAQERTTRKRHPRAGASKTSRKKR